MNNHFISRKQGGNQALFVLLVIAVLTALLLPGVARAEVIEVACAPSATIALGQAIEQANAAPGPDTIRLEGDCTYGLFGAYVYDEGQNGLPVITDELTIEGNGARLERAGAQHFRLLMARGDLTIEDLTLANGYALDPNDDYVRGGALAIEGNLTLSNVAVLGNTAGGWGGGIYVYGDEVRILNSYFESNQSTLGSGGALFVENGNVLLQTVSFEGNQAEFYGGAATLDDTSAFIFDSRFVVNAAVGGSGDSAGGALALIGGEMTINGSEFGGNQVPEGAGGAVFALGFVTVTDTIFDGNGAYQGGAIHAYDARLFMSRSRLVNNEVDTYGAALYLIMRDRTTSHIGNNVWAGNESAAFQTTVQLTAPVGYHESTLAYLAHNTFAGTQPGGATAVALERGAAQVVNNVVAGYRFGLSNAYGSVSAGYNLYDVTAPAEAQLGTIAAYGDGVILIDDPLFVDRGGGDYRLQEGSPAIDDGYDTGYNTDIDSTARPQGEGYDIGAYEFVPLNSPPTAADDHYATLENDTLIVAAPGVLQNDADAEGTSLTAVLESPPAYGALTLNADGGFSYEPDPGYAGSDAFTYRASDGEDSSAVATVSLDVQNVNVAPVAQDDAYATLQDTQLVIAAPGVLDNDEDADGDALVVALQNPPLHGDLTLNVDGAFSYTPDAGYVGQDSFSYRANDGEASSDDAIVTIVVEEANTNVPPTAVGDRYETNAGATLTVLAPGVLVNDADANGDPLSALLVSGPANGQLLLEDSGGFVYTPDDGFSGEDSFEYQVHDGVQVSAEATVRIIVLAQEPPGEQLGERLYLPMFVR